ncbi:MAG: hypothetical protein ACOZQL_05030 [Myxococcota bacterium]
MTRLIGVLLATLLSACGGPRPATSVCTIDGGAKTGVPLAVTVTFDISGCASNDARCSASVDGGTIQLSSSATLCSTGTNPGGVMPSATCAIPALTPGTYTLAPFGRSLEVLADGGGGSACP